MKTYLSGTTGNEYRFEKGVVMVNYAHHEGNVFCLSQLSRESFNHRVASKHWSLMSEQPATQYYRGDVSHRLYREKAGVKRVFLNGGWNKVRAGSCFIGRQYTPVASADEYMRKVDSDASPYTFNELDIAFGEVKPEVAVPGPGLCNETAPISSGECVIRGVEADVIIMDDTHEPEPTPPPTLHLNRNMAAIIATQPPTAGYAPVNHSEINFNF